MKRFLLIYLGLLCFVPGPLRANAMSDQEIIDRLDALTQIVAQQQEEIQCLKQQLESQKSAVKEAGKKEGAGPERAAVEQPDKKKKTDWTERVKLSGDLRLRYEGIFNREQRQTDGSTKDLPNRDRYRLRARLFVDGKISDEINAHFMICTNQDSNKEATTTNQSFSHDFNDKDIYLHRAYAIYKPNWLKGLELTAGKFKNTFTHTDIMWDPDVNPEGIYERYQYHGWNAFAPFVHLGQLAVNEENLQANDASLFIYQGGFDWQIGPVKWTLAGSYYDWGNLENTEYLHAANYKGGGGNTYYSDGTTLQYRYDYKLFQAVTFVGFKLGNVPAKLIFDYIKNTADNIPDDHDTAYYAGFNLGQSKQKGDMNLAYKYARIERDAVIGSLNDQDFYGANRKGHKLSFGYMFLDNVKFGAAYFYTDPVTAWVPASANWSNEQAREHEERFQGDLIFSF